MTNKIPLQNDESILGICSRLKFLREKHFGTRGKRKFAHALGLPLSTYVNYETQRVPPSDVLVKVSEITSCDLNWLMTGQGSMDTHHAPDPELSEILVRMEKIISTQPKAKQAVTALMDLLSANVNSENSGLPEPQLKDLKAPENKQLSSPAIPAGRNVIPILGRVAAGEPAPWAHQDNTSITNMAAIVSGLDAGAVRQKNLLGLFGPNSDTPSAKVEVIELCEPVAFGKLMVDSFIVTAGLKPKGDMFAVTITGDSMSPQLREGDYVIADTGVPLAHGSIVLAELEKHYGTVCKIYMQDVTHVVLNSYNSNYSPILLSKSQVKWMVKVVAAIKK